MYRQSNSAPSGGGYKFGWGSYMWRLWSLLAGRNITGVLSRGGRSNSARSASVAPSSPRRNATGRLGVRRAGIMGGSWDGGAAGSMCLPSDAERRLLGPLSGRTQARGTPNDRHPRDSGTAAPTKPLNPTRAFLALRRPSARRRSVREAAHQNHIKTISTGKISSVEDTTVRTWLGWSARHKWVSRSLARDEWIARTSDDQIVIERKLACKLALTTRGA